METLYWYVPFISKNGIQGTDKFPFYIFEFYTHTQRNKDGKVVLRHYEKIHCRILRDTGFALVPTGAGADLENFKKTVPHRDGVFLRICLVQCVC